MNAGSPPEVPAGSADPVVHGAGDSGVLMHATLGGPLSLRPLVWLGAGALTGLVWAMAQLIYSAFDGVDVAQIGVDRAFLLGWYSLLYPGILIIPSGITLGLLGGSAAMAVWALWRRWRCRSRTVQFLAVWISTALMMLAPLLVNVWTVAGLWLGAGLFWALPAGTFLVTSAAGILLAAVATSACLRLRTPPFAG